MRQRTENLTTAYPTGVRALLPADARRRRLVENSIVAILEAQRFEEIVLPVLDFVEPYAGGEDRELQRSSYRFIDRDGEIISVRSDFTPMVARALAPALEQLTLPLKVFYRGDVVRYVAPRLGARRELFQIGAELVGDASPQADLAMIALAVELITTTGISPTVVVADSRLATQLIENSVDSPFGRRTLRSALANKRSSEIDTVEGLTPERAAFLRRLISGRVTVDELASLPETSEAAAGLIDLQRRAAEPPAQPAATSIPQVREIPRPSRTPTHARDDDSCQLRETGADPADSTLRTTPVMNGTNVVLAVDDIDEDPGYYSGIRFRMFDPACRTRLAQGGRYDQLYARFGSAASAIGFTLTVDSLEGVSQ